MGVAMASRENRREFVLASDRMPWTNSKMRVNKNWSCVTTTSDKEHKDWLEWGHCALLGTCIYGKLILFVRGKL